MNKSITIIAASDYKINETLQALHISSKHLSPFKTIFFSSKYIPNNKKYKDVFHEKINPINSLNDYSKFILYDLYKFIETSHVLIVQWDGYIINPQKWSEKFLNYDYLGAPFIPRSKDQKYCRDRYDNFFVIGNGGFSLRSTKLLRAAEKYNLNDEFSLTNNHEDGFLCVLHRRFLEKQGYKWAPFKIAKQFSIESPITFNDFKELPFGFHGKKLLLLIRLKKIIDIILYIFLLKFIPINDYMMESSNK